jgi:DNA-binding IscR family transcriptional regulator
MNLLAYADGSVSSFDIALRIGAPLSVVVEELAVLKNAGLVVDRGPRGKEGDL